MEDDTVGRVAKKWQPPCKMFQNDTLGSVGNNRQNKAFHKEMARNKDFLKKSEKKLALPSLILYTNWVPFYTEPQYLRENVDTSISSDV